MHIYYINAFRDFQEKNLLSGQRIALAMLNCFSQAMTSQVDLSRMLMQRGNVHFDTDHPDLNALWATLLSDEGLRQSMMSWVRARIQEGGEIGALMREAFEQQASDVNEITQGMIYRATEALPGADEN